MQEGMTPLQEANRRHDEAHDRVESAKKELDAAKERLAQVDSEGGATAAQEAADKAEREWQRAVVDRDEGAKAIESEIRKAGSSGDAPEGRQAA